MDVAVSLAQVGDAGRLHAALARLSGDLGDRHAATEDVLARAGWGEAPVFRAHLAETGQGDLAGIVLCSPCFSTVQGCAGIYVSDLWTAPEMRGKGLGRRLLQEALRDGGEVWGAAFIKLSAYHGSADALRFYGALGFRPLEGQHDLILDREVCAEMQEAG